MKKALLVFVAIMVSVPLLASAQGTFDGQIFGDYYYVSSHHLEEVEGLNGFILRRVHFRYCYKFNEEWSSFLRFEATHPGDFVSNDKLVSYVKDAYLQYKMDNSAFKLGIMSNLSSSSYDSTWGYRSVESYPMSVQKFIPSREFGLGYDYKNEAFAFKAIFGNGEDNKNEANKGKSYTVLLSYGEKTGIYAEAYYNYLSKDDGDNETLLQGFLAYRADWGRLGVFYGRKTIDIDDTESDYNVLSVFACIPVAEDMEVFARYDKTMDANPKGDSISYLRMSSLNPSNYLVGGLSYKVNKNISFIPNVQYVFYDEEDGIDTDSDLILRATFCYTF